MSSSFEILGKKIYTDASLAAGTPSESIKIPNYDSYVMFGSTSTTATTFTIQNSLDNNSWWYSSNTFTPDTNGRLYAAFPNDSPYIRVVNDTDCSNTNIIFSARRDI